MKVFQTRSKPADPERTPEHHPAYQLGARVAKILLSLELGLATSLNNAMLTIGFRLRNGLLAVLGVIFLLYFIALLMQ